MKTDRIKLLALTLFTGVLITGFIGCRGSKVGTGGAVCGNSIIEGEEVCDGESLGGASCSSLNLGIGDISCNDDCTFDVSGCSVQGQCGNGDVEYPELCDGTNLAGMTCEDWGFSGGTLSCTDACVFDTSACEIATECGDGVQEGDEACDGSDLGGASCESLGLGGGSLGCTNTCVYDTSSCEQQAECGNGIKEGNEACDGSDLGGAACQDVGFYDGTLGCLEDCSVFDTSECVGTCGDGLLNGEEVCDGTDLAGATCQDAGYYGGFLLGCLEDCSGYDTDNCEGTCGDGILNGPEVCDGSDLGGAACQDVGFYGGTLGCLADCTGYDTDSCEGTCGDGIINGDEVCDGDALNGEDCESHGYNPAGTLACLPDCTDYDISGCIDNLGILVNEISLGNPDGVELINVSTDPIDLENWELAWWGYTNDDPPQAAEGIVVLPAFVLQPGERVEIRDEYPGSGDPAEVIQGVIYSHVNLWWYDIPGAVAVVDPNGDVSDFARWGDTDFDPPMGAVWSDNPDILPSFNTSDYTLSRVPGGEDTDTAGDFCVAPRTMGAENNEPCMQFPSPGTLIINEIDSGQPDAIELYNPGNTDINLNGWILIWTSGYNGGSSGGNYLPNATILGGGYVVIYDNAYNNPWVDGGGNIHIQNIDWSDSYSGSCVLESPVVREGIDFVRWGGSTQEPTDPDTWADTPDALAMVSGGNLARKTGTTDTDTADDWCLQADTLGDENTTCN